MEEYEIEDNDLNLIFEFEEIVELGYRESVNMEKIRKLVEME
jgi:hypothetical protein